MSLQFSLDVHCLYDKKITKWPHFVDFVYHKNRRFTLWTVQTFTFVDISTVMMLLNIGPIHALGKNRPTPFPGQGS